MHQLLNEPIKYIVSYNIFFYQCVKKKTRQKGKLKSNERYLHSIN